LSTIKNTVKRALIKLLLTTVLLVALILLCFAAIDSGLKAVIGAVIVIIVGPSVLLLGIDVSRAIKQESLAAQSVKVLGRVLGVPQALIGVMLVAWGAAYPAVFGIHDIIVNVSSGTNPTFPVIYTITAGLMFLAGLNYLREGLGLMGFRNKPTNGRK
jgi:hypothetical protein